MRVKVRLFDHAVEPRRLTARRAQTNKATRNSPTNKIPCPVQKKGGERSTRNALFSLRPTRHCSALFRRTEKRNHRHFEVVAYEVRRRSPSLVSSARLERRRDERDYGNEITATEDRSERSELHARASRSCAKNVHVVETPRVASDASAQRTRDVARAARPCRNSA